MNAARFIVETQMEQEDYHKFLYLATFRRSPLILPMVAVLALMGVLIVVGIRGWAGPAYLLVMWLLFFILAVGGTCLMVEVQNNRISKRVKSGAVVSRSRITLYDQQMTVEVPESRQATELAYGQLHMILESKIFFILYVSPNQALLIRKQDAEDPSGIRQLLKEACGKRYRCISK